ncbi:MAG: TspO/MBR family protein [Herpetosiphon sp.]
MAMGGLSTSEDWRNDVPRFIGALLLPVVVGGGGAIATAKSLTTWYPTLEKPSFNPPNWIFGPVWTTLYLLMGIAHFLISRQGVDPKVGRQAQVWYGIQLALNGAWSVLFFGRRSPLAALVEIVLLWLAIGLTIRAFARIDRRAAALLVPYLLWVSFAAVLNGAIWRLNS